VGREDPIELYLNLLKKNSLSLVGATTFLTKKKLLKEKSNKRPEKNFEQRKKLP